MGGWRAQAACYGARGPPRFVPTVGHEAAVWLGQELPPPPSGQDPVQYGAPCCHDHQGVAPLPTQQQQQGAQLPTATVLQFGSHGGTALPHQVQLAGPWRWLWSWSGQAAAARPTVGLGRHVPPNVLPMALRLKFSYNHHDS